MASDFSLYGWVVLPLLIFTARVLDVSLGTVRLIMVARGYKYLAPIIGFVEILIWIVAIGQIMQNLSNWVCYAAYAGGFATGNYVGMWVAEKLSLGMVMIRVVTQKDATDLVNSLRTAKYGVTSIDGEGTQGRVKVIFTIVARRDIPDIIEKILKFNPKAFYTVEEVSQVCEGVVPKKHTTIFTPWLWTPRPYRKGK